MTLPQFQKTSEDEAQEVVERLRTAVQLGPVAGIGCYVQLTKKGPRRKILDFLDQISRLPPFDQLGDLKSKLGSDCLKWEE